jgi:hypothetical protein
MRIPSRVRPGLGVLTAAGLLAAIAMRSPPLPPAECTFTVKASIPIGPDPAAVPVTFTESVGDSLSAVFPPESNVTVVRVAREKSDGPLNATLVINTVRATAKQWDVTIRGEKGVCTGKVTVGALAPKPKPDSSASIFRLVSAHECAAFMEDSIPAGSDRVESIVKFSEPAGDSLAASFPKEAGIAVIFAKRMSGDDPFSAHLVLNTVRAVPGQWKLTLVGDQTTCSGGVYVGKKKR